MVKRDGYLRLYNHVSNCAVFYLRMKDKARYLNIMDKLTVFAWYGGKNAHLNWLLPIIESIPHITYVEPFAGSAAVLLNKTPSLIEVYNDIYSEVVNFFKVLRTQKDQLIESLQFTPYSREEYVQACNPPNNLPELEQARLFYVKAKQIRSGLATQATPGRWSYTKKDPRRGMPLPVSKWLSGIEGLEDIYKRLITVQFENLDALDVIKRYDTENTLMYVDPPYLLSSRSGGIAYAHEFSEQQHIELLDLLNNIKGKVVISGYDNDLYNKMLAHWERHEAEMKIASTTGGLEGKKLRQEVVWIKR